jgi:hypothetical protein
MRIESSYNATILAMTWAKTPLVVLFFAILVDETAGAAAGDATTRARLGVRAAPECTTRADLVARVEARSPRIQFVDDAALTVKAVFTTPRPGKVVGEVVLSHRGGKRSSRRVLARSCADAADAVALIIAVTLDPTSADDSRPKMNTDRAPESGADSTARASIKPSSSPPPTEVPIANPAEQSVASPKTEALVEAKVPAASPAKLPAASAKTEAPVAAAKPEEDYSDGSDVATRSRFGALLAGHMIFGPTPRVMPGLAFYTVAGLDRDALWSPAAIVGATYVWRDSMVEPGGTASFNLYAASLDACPFRVSVLQVEARACASALVGLLAAKGFDTNAPTSSKRPFATAGGAVVLTAGLGSVVEASARLAMGMTLVRDSFEFGSTIFYQASPITTSASLGVGARLP